MLVPETGISRQRSLSWSPTIRSSPCSQVKADGVRACSSNWLRARRTSLPTSLRNRSQLALAGKTSPSARLIGIDPDQKILKMASAKLARSGVSARLCCGYLREVDSILGGASVTKIVSSLVFHQVPLAEKEAGLRSIIEALTPGGEVHIADYGLQRSIAMRTLFRLVQCVDGFADTQPNADGVLPDLMRLAGFIDVEETAVFPTLTGSISLYRGRKPELAKPLHRTRSSF